MLSQLKLQLILKEIKQTDIARAARVSRSYVNRIVLNKQKCSAKVAKAFREVAGIEIETGRRSRPYVDRLDNKTQLPDQGTGDTE